MTKQELISELLKYGVIINNPDDWNLEQLQFTLDREKQFAKIRNERH